MKLRTYREKLNIRADDAAKAIGISESQLSRIETGKHIPKAATMRRISEWSEGTVLPADFYDTTPTAKEASK